MVLMRPHCVQWCGHCKHLTPEYKKLGAAVAADPSLKNRVVIAKVGTCACSACGGQEHS